MPTQPPPNTNGKKLYLLRDPGWLRKTVRNEGKTLREIAEIVGCNRKTVREYLTKWRIQPTQRP